MTALSIDYVITLTGGAPSGGRCHTNVNTIEKLHIICDPKVGLSLQWGP